MVGLIKQAIKKTLGRAFVTQIQLETILVEIEAMLNDRSLTYVSSDLADARTTDILPHTIWQEDMSSTPLSRCP